MYGTVFAVSGKEKKTKCVHPSVAVMMSPPRSQAAGIPRDAGFRFTHVNVQMLMLAHPLTSRHDFAALNLDSNNQRL